MRLRSFIILSLPAVLSLSGCSQKYTRHMSETYKDTKIGHVTFAVLAVPSLDYRPPSSCFGGGRSDADADKYRDEWEKQLIKTLSSNFPKQKFISITPARMDEIGIPSASLFSSAETDIEKMGVQSYDAQGGQEKPIDYQPSRQNAQMRMWGQKLKEKDSIDFIIALVHPKMTGEVTSTPGTMMPTGGPGGGMMMTGGSTSTSYTSDARFGIWSAETGELAYASGSIAASSGFCIFVSPQSASINDNTGDMAIQLKALVTAFLQHLPADRIRLGQASFPDAASADRLR